MSEEVRQTTPPDDEMSEYWERIPGDEESLRGVEVYTGEFTEGCWYVALFAGEFFRADALGQELDQRLVNALLAVPGVTRVSRPNWEQWDVSGTASGEALCRAAANVVDELLERMRVAYYGGPRSGSD